EYFQNTTSKTYNWTADLDEYQREYEANRPQVNFVQERVLPIYEQLLKAEHRKYILLLLDYEPSFARLEVILQEGIKVNGRLTQELEAKALELLTSFVEEYEEIEDELEEERHYIRTEMNKALT